MSCIDLNSEVHLYTQRYVVGLLTVSSLKRCLLFRVFSIESSAVLQSYQQVCINNKLAGCIYHNLKQNVLAIAVM